jgi:Ulp1 family protease
MKSVTKLIRSKKIKKAKPGEIHIHYESEKVSWGSMWRLLNPDTKLQSKRWINNEVINFYFKKYLAEMDEKQCQEGSE